MMLRHIFDLVPTGHSTLHTERCFKMAEKFIKILRGWIMDMTIFIAHISIFVIIFIDLLLINQVTY